MIGNEEVPRATASWPSDPDELPREWARRLAFWTDEARPGLGKLFSPHPAEELSQELHRLQPLLDECPSFVEVPEPALCEHHRYEVGGWPDIHRVRGLLGIIPIMCSRRLRMNDEEARSSLDAMMRFLDEFEAMARQLSAANGR